MNNEKIENFSNQNLEKELEFEKYIQELENEEYETDEDNFLLPENPTPIQELKYSICQELIKYKRNNQLDIESFMDRTKTDEETAKEILYCHIDKIEINELVNFASNIFNLKLGILGSRAKFFPSQKYSLNELRL